MGSHSKMASARAALGAAFLCLALLTSGCGSSVGTVKLAPGEGAFATGKELFDQNNLSEAALQLKAYLDASPAGTHAEEASFLLGMAYSRTGQYALAEVELRHFIDAYPASTHLPEVEYRLATCFWEDARPAPYDQEKTLYARDQLQRFLTLYPDSPFVVDAKQLMSKVRERLAEKAVTNARLYLKLRQPVSTVYFAERALSDYGDTSWAAEALYLKGEGLFQQGKKDGAREAWAQLVRERADTEWAEKARGRLAETTPQHP